jgi:hypothetical protein
MTNPTRPFAVLRVSFAAASDSSFGIFLHSQPRLTGVQQTLRLRDSRTPKKGMRRGAKSFQKGQKVLGDTWAPQKHSAPAPPVANARGPGDPPERFSRARRGRARAPAFAHARPVSLAASPYSVDAMGLSLRGFLAFFALWEGIYWVVRRLLRTPAAVRSLTPAVRRDAPAYVVSTLHALFAASRGVRHVAGLWRAPPVLKNAIPIGDWLTPDMLPYLPEARAVVTTNIGLAAYLTADLAHVIVQYPKLGGFDTVAHHFAFLACALIAGSGDLFP